MTDTKSEIIKKWWNRKSVSAKQITSSLYNFGGKLTIEEMYEREISFFKNKGNERIIEFFKTRPALSISTLEREAGLAPKTLAHALKGRRTLTPDHVKKLIPVLQSYGFKKD